MGKNKENIMDYSDSNGSISQYLYDDLNGYIEDLNIERTMKLLPLLVESGYGCKILIWGNIYSTYYNDYRVACKMITKYNKNLKEFRKELSPEEFGGSENTNGKTNKELIKLAKYALQYGTYFAQMDKKTYMVYEFTHDENDDDYIRAAVYFVGKNWRKYRNEYVKERDKYNLIAKKGRPEYITNPDRTEEQEILFKPMEQFIMKNKKDLLDYIDNWKKNIPTYYEQYSQVAKLSILLYGKPGTGKSTLAKSLAKYLGLHYVVNYSVSDFRDNIPQNGQVQYTRRRRPPVEGVIAIDDIDCIAKSREDDESKENNEVVHALLSFLDNPPTFNFKADNGIKYPVSIVIATTNYIDKLDEAVKRFGRFDKTYEMKYLDREDAEEMCDIYGVKLSDITDKYTEKKFKISPAELEAKCKENIDKAMKES